FVLGAGSGAALGAATYKRPRCNPDVWCFDMFGQGGQAAVGAVMGAVSGTLVGLIIGSRPRDNWVPVAVPGR
ncbi:MAG TPA: hypothetical protein VK571_09805, partial [Gemmatimonadaceae bacterium]|nr:hypothetical protein [Gemmatimonadaceae bacterium]